MHLSVCAAALFSIAKTQKPAKHPSTDEWIKDMRGGCVCVCVCARAHMHIHTCTRVRAYMHIYTRVHAQWNTRP